MIQEGQEKDGSMYVDGTREIYSSTLVNDDNDDDDKRLPLSRAVY